MKQNKQSKINNSQTIEYSFLPSIFDSSKKRGFSFGSSQKQSIPVDVMRNALSNPGVGTYDQNFTDRKRVPSVIMGKAERGPFKQQNLSPGPGDYDLLQGSKSRLKGVTMGVRYMKSSVLKDSPGPQTYNLQYESVENQRFKSVTMQFKRNLKLFQSIPGVGTYDISGKYNQLQYRFVQ